MLDGVFYAVQGVVGLLLLEALLKLWLYSGPLGYLRSYGMEALVLAMCLAADLAALLLPARRAAVLVCVLLVLRLLTVVAYLAVAFRSLASLSPLFSVR